MLSNNEDKGEVCYDLSYGSFLVVFNTKLKIKISIMVLIYDNVLLYIMGVPSTTSVIHNL